MPTDSPLVTEIATFFAERLPEGWTSRPPQVTVDADEILVVLRLDDPGSSPADGGDADASIAACKTSVATFREESRERRVEIAAEAELRFERKVSWGVRCGEIGVVFTHISVPAMTRLRIKERAVLDTLIDAGVARSRSDALAWCVRLVGRNLDEWLDDLRTALVTVEEVRRRGPGT